MLKLALALSAVASAHDFSVCQGATDHLGVDSVSLTPDPPVAGGNLAATFAGKTDSSTSFSAGTATLKVSAFGIVIATVQFDMCKDMGVTCPIKASDVWTGSLTYAIPSAAPSGVSATAEADMVDGDGNKLSCITMQAQIGKPSGGLLRSSGATRLSVAEIEFLFEQWRIQHGHVHTFNTPEKYAKGLSTFAANLERIMDHNAGDHSYTMGMNEFGHLTWEEFRARFNLGTPMPENAFPAGDKLHTGEGMVAPSSVDWTTKGAVTPVKNQGQCGSCWAFSTTGSLEGEFFLKNGNLQSFSEQQLVSCDDNGDQGCNGGLMDNAFGWIKENGGLCSESSYPYTAQTGTCKSGCTNVPNSAPSTHTDVAKNEQALMTAVAQQPASIAIEADQSGFQFYSGGVFTGNCGTNLDHGVLAVGYGTESGSDYWKVKNSWGATWGDQGYIMLQRGKSQNGGQCGILLSASYPTL